jgi:hypothetical protein
LVPNIFRSESWNCVNYLIVKTIDEIIVILYGLFGVWHACVFAEFLCEFADLLNSWIGGPDFFIVLVRPAKVAHAIQLIIADRPVFVVMSEAHLVLDDLLIVATCEAFLIHDCRVIPDIFVRTVDQVHCVQLKSPFPVLVRHLTFKWLDVIGISFNFSRYKFKNKERQPHGFISKPLNYNKLFGHFLDFPSRPINNLDFQVDF